MNRNVESMFHGSVVRTLVSMTFPVLLGIVSVLLFNIIDTIFVSRLGTDELAALSFTFPVVAFATALAMALSVCTVIMVSSAHGAGEHRKARELSRDSLLLALIFSLLLLAIGIGTIKPLFLQLGAGDKLLHLIYPYMTIWYFGIFFLALSLITNALFRATGDMRTPTVLMVLSVFSNVIFDPIFMFGFACFPPLGLEGAAWAGLISRALPLGIALQILIKKRKIVSMSSPAWKPLCSNWGSLLSIAIPIAATNLFFPISTAIITMILAQQGNSAVAAFGPGARVEGFALFVPTAICTALSPFISANLGAGNTNRIREGVYVAQWLVVIWGVLVWLLIACFREKIALLFSNDDLILKLIAPYFAIVLFGLPMQGLCSITISVFNAMKLAKRATVFMAIRLFGLLIPAIYLGEMMYGILGAWIGIAIGNFCAGCIAYLWLKQTVIKQGPTNSLLKPAPA